MFETIYITSRVFAQGKVVGHDGNGRTIIFDGVRNISGFPMRGLIGKATPSQAPEVV